MYLASKLYFTVRFTDVLMKRPPLRIYRKPKYSENSFLIRITCVHISNIPICADSIPLSRYFKLLGTFSIIRQESEIRGFRRARKIGRIFFRVLWLCDHDYIFITFEPERYTSCMIHVAWYTRVICSRYKS